MPAALTYSPARRRAILIALAAGLCVVAALSLTVGAIPTGLRDIATHMPAALFALFGALFGAEIGGEQPTTQLTLILAEIRIPRLLLGVLVGAALAMCGAVMQGLFRNPMADPGLLGVSSGAALGAVVAIVLGAGGAWLVPGAAFGGGLLCLLGVHRLSIIGGKTDIGTMLLAGVAINAIAGAGIGLLTYLADDAQLRNLIFWSLGSLEIIDRGKLLVAAAFIAPVLVLLPRFALALNANLLGEREAGHLGMDMEKVKRRLIVLVALAVGAAVSLSGVIGFVGLIVPHLIRIATGADHRLLLPAAALFGAMLLTLADVVARSAAAPAEIPIGVITALLGGPFFLCLLARFTRRRATI